MTNDELAAIEQRAREDQMCGCRSPLDTYALIAEVKRLQAENARLKRQRFIRAMTAGHGVSDDDIEDQAF